MASRFRLLPSDEHAGVVGALVVAAVLAACSSTQLVPLESRARATAVVPNAGLAVNANAQAVARPSTVPHTLTPVRISVHNAGPAPVYVALGDIRLAAGRLALEPTPPTTITPRRRVASLGVDPGSPFIAPQVHGAGSRYGRVENLILSPAYGSQIDPSFGVRDGSRAEILKSAFDGGAIESGETREGFVYFSHVPNDAGRLLLRIGVRPSANAAPVSILEIPYALRS